MIKQGKRFDEKNPDKDGVPAKAPARAGTPVRKRGVLWALVVAVAALAVVVPLALWGTDDNGAVNGVAADQTPPVDTGQVSPDGENKGYATAIRLSLNPDIEIRLDAEDIVTEVVGMNEDGTALIEGIDFAGMSLQNATIMVVNQLILQGYITAAEVQEEINISLSSDTMTLDTLSIMTNIIESAAAEHNIAVDVIQDADANTLQIVLEGEGAPDIWPDLPPEQNTIGLEMEFMMAGGTDSAYVDNVLIHTPDGETIDNLLDFAGMRLNRAALYGIIELLDKGYITDTDDSQAVRLYFTGKCAGSDIDGAANLTTLLLAEYDMQIAVTTDTEKKEIRLVPDDTVTHEAQASKYAIRDVLNHMVNKDEEDLSPRQAAILKMTYNYREYQRLLEKRYYVIVPDCVGMTEEQAVDMLRQFDITPVVVREKVPGYDPELENGGLPAPADNEEQNWVWDFPVVGFGCVFSQDIAPGSSYEAGLHIQINVIVPENDERPEVADYRPDSGIVIRQMDVPFDVSGYPDTFSLSDAEGFEAMIQEMNKTYTIENKADYTVTIDRNTGWEGTAVITIAHRDGFPMSKFFVQDGRIIEHELLWQRGVPTAEYREH
jgi:hypothetical protein